MTNNNKKYKIGCFPGANPENGLISEIVKKAKSVNQFWDLAGSSLLWAGMVEHIRFGKKAQKLADHCFVKPGFGCEDLKNLVSWTWS